MSGSIDRNSPTREDGSTENKSQENADENMIHNQKTTLIKVTP